MNKLYGHGTYLGLPYDWRKPSWARLRQRVWNPGGPMFSPKVFGWGYTLNLAHRGAWYFLGAVALALLIAAAL